MKKTIISFWMLFVATAFSQEKKITPILLSTQQLVADEFITMDSFGYLYYVKGNVFYKQKENELFQYKNLSLGKIKRVDLQNPLKIVLFYEGFNSVVTLDNQLNETASINFSKIQNNPIVTSAVGLASQNRLWIFNSLQMQLGLYDFNKQVFQPLSQPFQKPIEFYQTDYNQFYWIDSNGLVSYCDVFGKISTLGKIPEFDSAQIISNQLIVYQSGNQLYYHYFKDNNSSLINLGEKIVEKFRVKDQFLFIFTNNEISTYQISLP
ncbi:hypothetical protein [Flavobacterium sp.]|jgi:hypothetical protein|uniref:hypothetical protein n=1 Tax=Flavobacterium sp. TaxID=239 RepID=UPI0037C0FCB7